MKEFFDAVRPMFGGRLSRAQVAGLRTLLAATEGLPVSHRAYLLATALHETARTMQPITEYGGRKYFDKYDTGRLAKALGNTPEADGDGYLYRGRGYVQITGRANYAKAGNKLDVDLIGNPEAALNPDLAARILVLGCSEGWFTGKKLSDYLPGDYVNARRVVNGTDKARAIADHARTFEAALAMVVISPTAQPKPAVTSLQKPQRSPARPVKRPAPVSPAKEAGKTVAGGATGALVILTVWAGDAWAKFTAFADWVTFWNN